MSNQIEKPGNNDPNKKDPLSLVPETKEKPIITNSDEKDPRKLGINSSFEFYRYLNEIGSGKIKDEGMKRKVYAKGVCFYFADKNSKVFETRNIPIVQPILQIASLQEAFKLLDASMWWGDVPVYFCFRGIPYSCSLNIHKFVEGWNQWIVEHPGHSSDEIFAYINSIYHDAAYRKHKIQPFYYLLILMTNIISIMTTILILTPFVNVGGTAVE